GPGSSQPSASADGRGRAARGPAADAAGWDGERSYFTPSPRNSFRCSFDTVMHDNRLCRTSARPASSGTALISARVTGLASALTGASSITSTYSSLSFGSG